MALKVRLNRTRLTTTPAQPYTTEAFELMRAIRLPEQAKAGSVTRPGEVFAVLLAMGYSRRDEMDIQSKAAEFLEEVRSRLTRSARQSPSYDDVVGVMSKLGYHRAAA